ncbi:hypothetical protein E2P81_ATG03369 [Venturia nashicola]|nr:hypothetical protein E2P81_ATG03369 [Venturia nashicola]
MSAWHTFAPPHGTRRAATTHDSANWNPASTPCKDRKRKRETDDQLDPASAYGWASGKRTSKKPSSPFRTTTSPSSPFRTTTSPSSPFRTTTSPSSPFRTTTSPSSQFRTTTSPTSPSPSSSSRQRDQYSPDAEIPLHPFPHAPQRPKTAILDRVRHELHSLNPPLAHLDPSWYEPSSQQAKEGLRESHLANLTTLLHHMLLKGDFERAGRAWGLLLRSGRLTKSTKTNTGYLSMDVTARNRWGIGAELLLRNTRHNGHVRHPAAMQGTDAQSVDMHFSEEGFRAARDYYERLIVQYPVHHQRKGPCATNFYAAMVSLWIHDASQRSKIAEQRFSNSKGESSSGHSSLEFGSDDERDGRIRAVKERELEDARAIAARLDHIIGAPPLDKNAELLQIRGMVALWVGTLQGGEAQEPAFENAKGLLLRSRANGGTLWEGVEHIVEEDDW